MLVLNCRNRIGSAADVEDFIVPDAPAVVAADFKDSGLDVVPPIEREGEFAMWAGDDLFYEPWHSGVLSSLRLRGR